MPEEDSRSTEALRSKLGPDRLKDAIGRIEGETAGLLDEEAVLALIADEEGLTETPFSTLAALDPARPVFTRCVVEAVEPVKEFRSRDRAGKLRKLRVADNSRAMTLTLWDEETVLVEQLGLWPGSRIRILSAMLKETRFGPEIQVGSAGFIVSEEESAPEGPSERLDIKDLRKAVSRADVSGVVLSLCTSGRGRQKTTSLRLFDGTGECEVVISHEQTPPPRELVVGMEIEITGARVDHCNEREMLFCDARSRIKTI